jgi:hypothetical protein
MKSHYKKPSPPFITIARNRRGDAVFKLKKGIERDRAIFGGHFTSELHWNESREDRQWFDFYFVGADRFTIWNAQITTARREFWYEVDELAFAHTAKLIRATERSQFSSFERGNARRSHSGKIQSYEWILKEEPRFAELGKKTFQEYAASVADEIAANAPPNIWESFQVDTSYRYGIGLSIVVDSPIIDKEVIEKSIDRFLLLGSRNWKADSPVAIKNLLPKPTH